MYMDDFKARSCTQKVRYRTAKEATKAATRTKHGRPYRCIFCERWHIGH